MGRKWVTINDISNQPVNLKSRRDVVSKQTSERQQSLKRNKFRMLKNRHTQSTQDLDNKVFHYADLFPSKIVIFAI